jgi:hypothetical protein
MADIPTPRFQTLWSHQIDSLRVEYRETIDKHPDAGKVMETVHDVLKDIASLAGCTPTPVGESTSWKRVITKAAETRRNLHQVLEGKPLYSALHGVYSEVLAVLKVVLQQSASKVQLQPNNEPAAQEEFWEQRRRKINPSEEAANKQKTMPTTGIKDPRPSPQQDVATRNYFAPLRTTEMECEGSTNEVADNPDDKLQQGPASQTGRPPPHCFNI